MTTKKIAPESQRILQLAALREERAAILEAARNDLAAVDQQIIPLVERYGGYSGRATKTKSLTADDGTQLRVTAGLEVTVHSDRARDFRAALRERGYGRLANKLFPRGEFFNLGDNAPALATARLSPELLRDFNGALRAKPKSPAVEVVRPAKSGRSRRTNGATEKAAA